MAKSLDEIFGKNINTTPTSSVGKKSLDEIFGSSKTVTPTIIQSQPQKGLLSKVTDVLGGLGAGAIKGIGSTALGMSELGQKTIGRAVNAIVPNNIDRSLQATENLRQQIKPEGTAEKIGFGAEQIAEYFLPASKAAKLETLTNILTKGLSSKLLGAGLRVAGKSAIQGLASGAISLAQTGGNLKEAEKTALTAGVIRGGFATIGEGIRAIRLPERLYSTLFKNTADDMLQELKTESLASIQKTNPEKFKTYVDKGLIKLGTSGQIEINPTIAKQALDSGLRGSIRNMTKTVIEGTLDSENKVQTIAQTYPGKIDLSEKQFSNILKSIGKDYEDVGFNEISNEAIRLANAIKTGTGKVSANDALAIRRLLDRARIASSYEKPVSKLSLTQGNLKTLADTVRTRVNKIPGMGETMQKYSFYIDALETLSREAARRGNTQALSLIDSLFLSGAAIGNPALGLSAAGLRRLLLSGSGMTAIAQLLNKGVASPTTIGAIGASSNELTNTMNR